jgi:GAF domain-containing protein
MSLVPAVSTPSASRSEPAAALEVLVMRLARATAAGLDVPAVLADVCGIAQTASGVRGVVAAVARRGEAGLGPLAGSDDAAVRIGWLQRDGLDGPLAEAIRSGRAVLTTDPAATGSPGLAAAAAEAGVSGLMTVPLVADGVPVGAVQLLGDAVRPVGPAQVVPLTGLLDVLAARLADADALRELRAESSAESDPAQQQDEADTAEFPAVAPPPVREQGRAVDVPTQQIRLAEPTTRLRTVGPVRGGPLRERHDRAAGAGGQVGCRPAGPADPRPGFPGERRSGPMPVQQRGVGWRAGAAGAPPPLAQRAATPAGGRVGSAWFTGPVGGPDAEERDVTSVPSDERADHPTPSAAGERRGEWRDEPTSFAEWAVRVRQGGGPAGVWGTWRPGRRVTG